MTSEKLAEWLIIGFKRAWLLRDVYVAAGLAHVACETVHAEHQFMPPDAFSIKRPVRAFIATEWPKLSAYLCKHEHDAHKLLSVVPQLVKLKAKGQRGEVRSAADIIDMCKERRDARAVAQSYSLSRASFKTNQRSAWTVCK